MGRAEVGPVSRVTDGEAYQPPPDVIEELDDPTAAFGGLGLEFNEKGLKLEYDNIQPGDRAEIFTRFPQRPAGFPLIPPAQVVGSRPLGRLGQHGAGVIFYKGRRGR